MARMTLEQVKAHRPPVDRRKIAATTEKDIADQMVEDGEMVPKPAPARKSE